MQMKISSTELDSTLQWRPRLARSCILSKYFPGCTALSPHNKEKNFAQVLTIPRPIVLLNNWTLYYILDMN